MNLHMNLPLSPAQSGGEGRERGRSKVQGFKARLEQVLVGVVQITALLLCPFS
jgi:hypothetical protein